MNISPCNILRFLNGPDFHPPVNTSEIDYRIEEIWKVTKKKIGFIDKMIHFWWIASLISINREEASWIVGGLGVNPQ